MKHSRKKDLLCYGLIDEYSSIHRNKEDKIVFWNLNGSENLLLSTMRRIFVEWWVSLLHQNTEYNGKEMKSWINMTTLLETWKYFECKDISWTFCYWIAWKNLEEAFKICWIILQIRRNTKTLPTIPSIICPPMLVTSFH